MNSISEPNDNEIRHKLNKKLNLFRNNKFDSLDSKLQGLIHEEGRRVKEYDEAKFTKYLQKLRKTLKKKPLKGSQWKKVICNFNAMIDSVLSKPLEPVSNLQLQHQKEMLAIFEAEKHNLIFAHPDTRQLDYNTLHIASLLYFRQDNKKRARDLRRKLLKIITKRFETFDTIEEYDYVLLLSEDTTVTRLFSDLEYESKMLKRAIDTAKERK